MLITHPLSLSPMSLTTSASPSYLCVLAHSLEVKNLFQLIIIQWIINLCIGRYRHVYMCIWQWEQFLMGPYDFLRLHTHWHRVLLVWLSSDPFIWPNFPWFSCGNDVAVLGVYRLFRYSCTYATYPIFISSPSLASLKSQVDPSHLGDMSGPNAIVASPTRRTCHTHSQTLPRPQLLLSSDQWLTCDKCAARRCLGISTTANSPQRCWATTYGHIRQPRSVSTSPNTDSAYRRTAAPNFSDTSSALTEISSLSTLSPTPAQTPLPIHSQHSHHPPIPTKLQLSHPYSDSDEMPDIEPCKGSNSLKENPQAWLHRLEGTKFKHDTDDKLQVYTFSKYLEYGSKADTWFTTELTVAEKSLWASLTSAFDRK